MGSAISKTGDTFAIKLTSPISVGGQDVIPAGVTGVGDVIHAKKSGGSGSAGELVLAARYLEVGGKHLLLRSMHLATSGDSKINTVNAIGIASAASPVPFGLLGLFIRGGKVVVPAGSIAQAKTAADFTMEPSTPSPVEHQ